MKSAKKVLCYMIVFIVGMFVFTGQVHAEDRWPGVSSSQIPSQYADMEYCVYQTGSVFESWSFSKGIQYGSIYNNSSYIFIYNSDANEIEFLGPNGDVHRIPNGNYTWKETTSPFLGFLSKIKSKVNFKSDLYSYMVDDRGVFSCNELYFVEDGNDLQIYTSSDQFASKFSNDEEILSGIETASGTRYGQSIVSQCDMGYQSLMNVANNYYNNNTGQLERIAELAKSNLQPGDGVKAQQYYNEFLTLYNNTINELGNLNLSENKNGSGFYIGKCSGINDLEREYKKFKVAINASYQSALDSLNKIKSEFQKMANNGVQGIEADLAALNTIQNNLNAAKSGWDNYLNNVNLGQAITDVSCEGLLGPDLLDDISTVLTWIRIAVPILLIVLGITDFAKALLSDDQQETKKATSRFVKRCIIAVAIFFIPSIIMYIISFIDKIADVSCDIRLW